MMGVVRDMHDEACHSLILPDVLDFWIQTTHHFQIPLPVFLIQFTVDLHDALHPHPISMVLPETSRIAIVSIFSDPDITQFLQMIAYAMVVGVFAHHVLDFGDVQCPLDSVPDSTPPWLDSLPGYVSHTVTVR